jgi:hypothetical protein
MKNVGRADLPRAVAVVVVVAAPYANTLTEDEWKNRPFQMRFLPATIRFLLMNTTPLDEDRLENGRLLFTTTSLGNPTL